MGVQAATRTGGHPMSLLPAANLQFTPDQLAAVDKLVPPGQAVADFLNPHVS